MRASKGPEAAPTRRQLSTLPFLSVWKDTEVTIPDGIPGDSYRNIFTGEVVTEIKQDGKRTLHLGEVFASFPVALLERQVN